MNLRRLPCYEMRSLRGSCDSFLVNCTEVKQRHQITNGLKALQGTLQLMQEIYPIKKALW